MRCRFAPTTSGPAHPGTLLAGLLCWLDARQRGARLGLRLEDVDPARCTPESAADMRAALRWLGLDWDEESVQSESRADHEAALDRLAEQGVLYACRCSRSEVRRAGLPAADGGFRYPGTCRSRGLPPPDRGGWRAAEGAVRLHLPPGRAADELGDPVLLRADGAVAYHLAVVVDDAGEGIEHIVRGRDLEPATAIHRVLQEALGLPVPTYRHHLLLLEERGGKLAKLHGAVGWHELAEHGPAARWCGLLARVAGLQGEERETTPRELQDVFDWDRVRERDQVLRWTGSSLEWLGEG